MEIKIYIIVYRAKDHMDDLLFRQHLSKSFSSGANISDGVYLIATRDLDTVDIMRKIEKQAKSAVFVAPLATPYCSRGFSVHLDEWFKRNGKTNVKEEQVKELLSHMKE